MIATLTNEVRVHVPIRSLCPAPNVFWPRFHRPVLNVRWLGGWMAPEIAPDWWSENWNIYSCFHRSSCAFLCTMASLNFSFCKASLYEVFLPEAFAAFPEGCFPIPHSHPTQNSRPTIPQYLYNWLFLCPCSYFSISSCWLPGGCFLRYQRNKV